MLLTITERVNVPRMAGFMLIGLARYCKATAIADHDP
jgi:hypothetical protein